MSNEELKQALQDRRAVVLSHPLHGVIEYSYVSAVIYRKGKNGVEITAELYDKNGRSVTIADPRYIHDKN